MLEKAILRCRTRMIETRARPTTTELTSAIVPHHRWVNEAAKVARDPAAGECRRVDGDVVYVLMKSGVGRIRPAVGKASYLRAR